MKLHHLQGYIQSIYLVEYPDRLMLLDGCTRADVDTLRHFITQELERPFSDLKVVMVTHMHPDHAGAAHQLRKLIGCKVISSDVEHSWYKGVSGWMMYLTDLALARWVAKRLGRERKSMWYAKTLKPDIKLVDKQTIPGFDEWCVFETPGHTDRDLSIMHMPSQRMYVADLVVKVKSRFIPPFPVFFPNVYGHSIDKLMDIRPQSILLAHGGEVQLDDADYAHLRASVPKGPQTPWRVVKAKSRRALGLKKRARK
ncbi:MBL fold metallo-hydrolase [Paraglaciecola chathamensis]|uniref:MBL fold metallo-hydrolase n=1 Tax=Paraglaciecola chathamensis TaxID=368405 RepID=UPI0026FEDFD5|nr:MBL fold metallo-hydrolase [Paraglaciecola chathamensis]MDO6561063.1 MBL fold metallo-hydrolase [Paraglaciecola chathamensis]